MSSRITLSRRTPTRGGDEAVKGGGVGAKHGTRKRDRG